LEDPTYKEESMQSFIKKMKLSANRKQWQRPSKRNVQEGRNFIDAHLKKLDQAEGGILG
jgi:hypothetical protein